MFSVENLNAPLHPQTPFVYKHTRSNPTAFCMQHSLQVYIASSSLQAVDTIHIIYDNIDSCLVAFKRRDEEQSNEMNSSPRAYIS